MPADYATLTADDLVTGEGVALDLPAASLGLRMGSGLLDILATAFVFAGLFMLLLIGSLSFHDDAATGAAFVLVMILTFLVIPATLETLTRGRSLGKLAFGLRTVRDDGGPISFHHAVVRALIGFVEIYAFSGAPAFFSVLVSNKGKRLGDYAAGTYVVRDRVPLQLRQPAPMPPQLAGWARRTDIAALPTGTALAVRQFLSRLPTLDPVARQRIATHLLADVMPYVAPAPPANAAPELVLIAILAERRERDLKRLRRDSSLRQRLVGSK